MYRWSIDQVLTQGVGNLSSKVGPFRSKAILWGKGGWGMLIASTLSSWGMGVPAGEAGLGRALRASMKTFYLGKIQKRAGGSQ